jgi:hypothetical protein
MAPSSDDKGKRPREEDHQDPKLKEEQEAGGSRMRNSTFVGSMNAERAFSHNMRGPTFPVAVTQHTTAGCSMQVVGITLAEQASTNITSLRMEQQKHCGPKYKLIHIYYRPKRDDTEMLPVKRTPQVLSVYSNWKSQIIKQGKNSTTYSYPTVARFLGYGTTLLVSNSSL